MQKLSLSIFIAIIFLMMGCKKVNNDLQAQENITFDSKSIATQTYKTQVTYAENNLKKIGGEIAKLSEDENFVNFVHTEARKKVSGEFQVLLHDLKKNPIWSNKLNSKELNEGLKAFKNIGGTNGANYYPQIYIPTFQYQEDENINPLLDISTTEPIKFIFYAGNEEVDSATNLSSSYRAFVYNNVGALEYWGLVNEEYANTHEVWVLSISETAISYGDYMAPCIGDECSGGGPGPGSGGNPDIDPVESRRPAHPTVGNTNNYLVNCKIQNMVVRDHKESWVSGASEVSVRAVLNCHNNLELGLRAPAPNTQYKSDQASLLTGKLICKVKRKDVRNQNIFNADYSLQTSWPSRYYITDPVWLDGVVFEKDSWPAEIQTNNMIVREDIYWPPYTGVFSPTWTLNYRSHMKSGTLWGYPYCTFHFASNSLVVGAQYQFYQSGIVNNAGLIAFNTIAY